MTNQLTRCFFCDLNVSIDGLSLLIASKIFKNLINQIGLELFPLGSCHFQPPQQIRFVFGQQLSFLGTQQICANELIQIIDEHYSP